MDPKDVVIIAGGKGSRLQSEIPKALVNAKGIPLIDYQLGYFLNSPLVKNIVLALGYGAGKVKSYVTSKYNSPRIIFSVETEPLGTAGALKKAFHETTSDHVLVLNCDDVTDIDIQELVKLGENSICVAHPRLPFGRVIDNEGYASFEEKPLLNDWVNCGWYLFNRSELLSLLPDKGSLEYDVFPNLKLRVFKHEGFWKTINTDKEIAEFDSSDLPLVIKKALQNLP